MLARTRRAEARQQAVDERAQARAEAAAARAAEQVDSHTAAQVSTEVVPDVPGEQALIDAPSQQPAAPKDKQDDKQKGKDPARRDRRAEGKAAARRAKAADRAAKDDHIVEPPREPKASLAKRLRPAGRSKGRSGGRRLIATLAGVIGALGLVCSLVLAFGALLVALDADTGGVYDVVSGVCDVLIGPLRDVFSFSGVNAETKEALVAWGAGAIIYLIVGMVAQSILRSAADDH